MEFDTDLVRLHFFQTILYDCKGSKGSSIAM